MLSQSQTSTVPKLQLDELGHTEALDHAILKHQINNIDRYYRKKLYLFLSQLLISLIVIGFCITQLVLLTDKESLYIAILTGVVGIWLGSPSSKYLVSKK